MAPIKKAAAKKKAPAKKAAAKKATGRKIVAAAKGVKVGTIVPLSVLGSFSINSSTAVAIGSNLNYPQAPTGGRHWWLVIDLSNLNVVASVAPPAGPTVPTSVAPYLAKGGYLVVFASVVCNFAQVPQGAAFSALKDLGAGYELDRLEQINNTLGCGFFTNYCYVLVGTTDDDGLPGFEQFSYDSTSILTLSLLPITVGGKTTYVPVKLDS